MVTFVHRPDRAGSDAKGTMMTIGKPGPSEAPVVSFEEVSKVYGPVRAVDGLSLDLRHGQTVAFLGPPYRVRF